MFDPLGLVNLRRPPDGDDVETAGRPEQSITLQKPYRRACHPTLLFVVDHVSGMSWLLGGERFHLDEDDHRAPAKDQPPAGHFDRDQIELSGEIGLTRRDDSQPRSAQIAGCILLTLDPSLGRQVNFPEPPCLVTRCPCPDAGME